MNRIRRDSPVPLYHQIAEALRNAIAVGELAPHARLPSVRAGAREWGVNLHTVRRAYAVLAEDGLVRMAGARGTAVVGGARAAAVAENLDEFLASCAQAGASRFGLTQLQLGQLLVKLARAGGVPMVHVIECSRTQAEGHCQELMRAWRVTARPLVLAETAALPSGVVIGTYFHYNDIRQRWPRRLEEVRFVAIAPDPELKARLPAPRRGGRGVARRRLVVCERDEAKAVNIAADLQGLFAGDTYPIEPCVLPESLRLPRARPGDVILVSPRVWGGLSERQRARCTEIRYCIRTHEIEALGATFGWQRTSEEEEA